ncbi:MAG: DegT/DnrJ/EryC1/StrS family aminotransferase [Acidobacteria bacterium]|nr:DegT/DnrJ/EryC1/StrS family aminotransferase [Acidobacteriota bacterium]
MSFLESVHLVYAELEQYHRESASGEPPVVNQLPTREIIRELDLEALLKKGNLAGGAFAEFIRRYLSLTVRLHHPGSLAHQVAVPHPAAALATLVEGFTNNPMAIYEMGPAAASIEAFMIDWLLGKVGWKSPDAGGVLTHGGSLANLTALVAARSSSVPDAWKKGNSGELGLLASEDCHYSITRAAGIMGIGEENIYTYPAGASGLALEEGIGQALERSHSAGKRPFAVVANACSTAAGQFEPLREVAAVCRRHGLWLHVDGAHGASALLSQKHRGRLDGVELADSLTWDAHKLLRTPGLCTALLVRDARTLDAAFQQDASYLFHDKQQPGFDSIHRTVECTKAALGLRLFTVLAAMGEAGVVEYVDGLIEVTQKAYQAYCEIPGVACPVEPQSNILCFRVPGDDATQLRVRDRLLAEGDFHLSTAMVGGRRHLRIVVTSPATTLAHLRRLASRALELAGKNGSG